MFIYISNISYILIPCCVIIFFLRYKLPLHKIFKDRYWHRLSVFTLNVITVPLSSNIHMTTTCSIDSNLEKKVRKYHLFQSQYLLMIIKINIFLHAEGKHVMGTLIKLLSCKCENVIWSVSNHNICCKLRDQDMSYSISLSKFVMKGTRNQIFYLFSCQIISEL
jgi:hypothetical protein